MLPDLPEHDGGLPTPVICTGRGSHPPELLSHIYRRTDYGPSFTAPLETVRMTRSTEALDVPGRSRESIRFLCPNPECAATPSVDRDRWGQIVDGALSVALPVFDVAALD